MIRPQYLKQGDIVGLIAPARKVTLEDVEPAIRKIQSWGLEVKAGDFLFYEHNQYAGIDSQRSSDLQSMLDDEQIRAILCARGGYGSVRLLASLNCTAFCRNPKWIIGYSDITALHSCLQVGCSTESIHALMAFNFTAAEEENESILGLKNVLFGTIPSYFLPPASLNRHGKGTGMLVGGNLSVLFSLRGTAFDTDTAGKILFLEDIDEYLYHVDRMMMNLKLGGKLDNLAGLVIGGLTDMKDNSIPFGRTAEEIIYEAVREYDYPVMFGFPAGHGARNLPLIMGRSATLEVMDEGSNLHFH
jgi:muramoyltetrapeptide carboxypeptidase